MLKKLLLKNLSLVEEAAVSFEAGFTVITGETGAGKTALIEAIRLLLGERADLSKLRKGADSAFIQGVFDLTLTQELEKLLEETGIRFNAEEELIVTREINANGKGRAFIAGQQVPLAIVQRLAPLLFDFIGQHASLTLKSPESQRDFLDRFSEIDTSPFKALWKNQVELEEKVKELEGEKRESEKKRESLSAQLEELNEVNPQEKEGEALFEEYTLLANSQDLLATSSGVLEKLDEALSSIRAAMGQLERICKIAPQLNEGIQLGKEGQLQLSELHALLQQFEAKVENDPRRLTFLEERLKIFNRLEKIYGQDLFTAKKEIKEKLQKVENVDFELESTQEALQKAKEKTAEACLLLTKQREKGGKKLASLLTKALRELNIPHAEVAIKLTPAPRTLSGEDSVSFYLQANLGERPVLIKEGSSGGELSRLYFSLKGILAEKNSPPTIVFDEIDANVGGKTATVMGEKLKALGLNRQVICITHFPQVASQADHHLRVIKIEQGSRTFCQIDSLDRKAKEGELLRMLGGKAVLSSYTDSQS